MADGGIDRAVVLPAPDFSSELGEYIYQSERVLRICRFHMELTAFCCIGSHGSEGLEAIEGYVAMGARGYGEHKVQLPIDHPSSQEIYNICGEMGIPVLIHVDDLHNYRFEEAFPSLASKYSKTVFIMHGPGWWRHISKEPGLEDYSGGPVNPRGLADKILSERGNVYADISAISGLNALERDLAYAKEFLERHRFRIVYGTDFPCIDRYGGQFGVNRLHLKLLESRGLEEGTFEAITFKNAERILRIS